MPRDAASERLIDGETAGGGGGVDVDENGGSVVSGADTLNFTESGLATSSVTDAGSGQADVDVGLAQSITPTWTGTHVWDQQNPSSGFNVFTRLRDATDGTKQIRWGINSSGEIQLRYTTGGGTPGTMIDLGSAFSSIAFLEQIIAGSGIRETAFQDYGASNDMRQEFDGTNDGLNFDDQTNTTTRARLDRTTGDLTIEGTLTEGATL